MNTSEVARYQCLLRRKERRSTMHLKDMVYCPTGGNPMLSASHLYHCIIPLRMFTGLERSSTISLSKMQQKSITIIGAGLVGSLLSIYLSRRGYTVDIFERRADMRKQETEAGRSINLAL